jgi:hypothetical protein
VWFEQAIRFIEACRRRSEAFFVYLPTNAPHEPLYLPERYKKPYLAEGSYLAPFYGMIANIDENFGRLEAFLRRKGLYDDTVLIFLTDNGGPNHALRARPDLYTAGMRGRKGSLYDGGHRVPCFIRWPNGNLRPSCDIDELTQCQDLLPTLIDLCDLETPAGAAFDGASLAPLLRGDSDALEDRMLVVQCARKPTPDKWHAAVLWGKWRLVEGRELYDIRSDPAQAVDVAGGHPDVVRRMRGHYERWWAQIEPKLADISPIVVGSEEENPSSLRILDWYHVTEGVSVSGQRTVRLGEVVNGPWKIEAARAGRYRVALRRWPAEAGEALGAGLPARKGLEYMFPEGKALPIAAARLKVGGFDKTLKVSGGELEAVFEIDLPAGETVLQTWFMDEYGRQL